MLDNEKQIFTGADIEVPDQTGNLAIVTGANSGIGLGVTRRLAAAGAEVILAVRNLEKGRQAVRDLLVENPTAKLLVESIDLADLGSVRAITARLNASGRPVDLLVNNAGVMTPPRHHTTTDGFELQFGANYLGHFALTVGLLPLLLKARSPRVTTLSSLTSHRGRIHFDDLQWERSYSPEGSYAQSKLANLLFAFELNRLSVERGWDLLSNAAHPGATRTNLQTSGPNLGLSRSGEPLSMRLTQWIPGFWQEIEQGCLPTLFAATSPRAIGGGYYGPGGYLELTGSPKPASIPRRALDGDVAKRLWQISEQLTGFHILTQRA